VEDSEAPPVLVSSLDPGMARTLSSLCLEYRRVGAEIDTRKETQKSLKESIEDLILSLPYKRLQGEGFSTVKSQKVTPTLNKQKLVEESISRGIDPVTVREILLASTEEKKSKEFIIINTEVKDKKESDTVNLGMFS